MIIKRLTYTTNFGQSWRLIDSVQSNSIRFADTKTGWVGNTGGSIRMTSANEPALYKWNGGNILNGIQTLDVEDACFIISPNPTSRFLTVSYAADFKPTSLTIFDVSGKIVLQKTDLSNALQTIDLQAIPEGIYLVQLKNTEGVVSRKIIVQR